MHFWYIYRIYGTYLPLWYHYGTTWAQCNPVESAAFRVATLWPLTSTPANQSHPWDSKTEKQKEHGETQWNLKSKISSEIFSTNGNAESKQSFWNSKYDQPCEIRLQSKYYQNTIHSQFFHFYFVRCLKSSSHWVFKLCSSSGDLQVWTNKEVRACRSLLDHEEFMAWNFKPFDKSRLLKTHIPFAAFMVNTTSLE